ncbi:MAG: acyl-CoA dehydrogenase family protein [Deltaproteobacteria bacterium]|nr:acyl-CoA dehydrogenase family protein [Deltaproteobacteria bacterium]
MLGINSEKNRLYSDWKYWGSKLKTEELPNLTISEEEREVLELAYRVCEKEIVPVRAELDEKEEFPEKIFEKFREVGFFRAMFDSKYGGMGLSRMMPFYLLEVIAERCLGVATAFGASTRLAALPIELGGTEEQKKGYLTKLASGEFIGAFALTEPSAGSDISNLSTTAVKKGAKYILNGTKQWITNAGRADIYCIFALTDRNKDPRASISCFIVEKGWPGLSFGKLERKLGIRCSHTRQVIMEDLEVPEENLIGLVPNKGLAQILRTLNRSRSGVAAIAVGLATGAYKEAVKYAFQREQFKQKVVHFQVIQHMLADMLTKIESARLLAYKAGRYSAVDHPDAGLFSAMAKHYASEMAMQVATDALQIHGGYGFSREYPIEKMFRDAKILSIYEGTNQMMKNQMSAYIVKDAGRFC